MSMKTTHTCSMWHAPFNNNIHAWARQRGFSWNAADSARKAVVVRKMPKLFRYKAPSVKANLENATKNPMTLYHRYEAATVTIESDRQMDTHTHTQTNHAPYTVASRFT